MLTPDPQQMVGSVNRGTMGDNEVEATLGAIISELPPKAALTLPQRPNVVIIQCGCKSINPYKLLCANVLSANDMSRNIDVPGAAARMGAVVDGIFAAVPETLIIISGLMPISDPVSEARSVGIYTPGLRQMVTDKNQQGQNIWFADMHDGYITLDDLRDGLHPNDSGHLKMGRLYYDMLVRLGDHINPPGSLQAWMMLLLNSRPVAVALIPNVRKFPEMPSAQSKPSKVRVGTMAPMSTKVSRDLHFFGGILQTRLIILLLLESSGL